MKAIKAILYIIWQWTWGFFQSLMGLCYMLKYRKCRHGWYHGAYVTYFTGWAGGISLGMFIFVGETTKELDDAYMKKYNKHYTKEIQEAVRVHEYGHTVQSLLLGPLYLFVVGIPSIIWAKTPKFVKMRQETGKKYCDLYCEKWANYCGKMVTGEEPINN